MNDTLFPRSDKYNQSWIAANLMGPNVLWLMESLCERLEIAPGMRVMDLGCGKAISSIFLAREFGVRVFATDLWIKPSDNWHRIREAGMQDQVFPIYAEARSLPYAHEFFDAIVSVDAYHYFGTDDMYLENVIRFLKPGGVIAISCPAFKKELQDDVPKHLSAAYQGDQRHSFHAPEWWRAHWEKTGAVQVTCADEVPHSWEIWKATIGPTSPYSAAIEADGGALLTFSRVVARLR